MSEIEAYARMFGFDTLEDRFDLMYYVMECDRCWLEEMRKRRPAQSGNAGKHTTRRR